jgi:hypothetical protein
MHTERKIELIETNFDLIEGIIIVHFYNRHDKRCFLTILARHFEQWLHKKGYLDIEYESYNPVTGDFKTISYCITESDFLSEDDYHEFREMLFKEYLKEIL